MYVLKLNEAIAPEQLPDFVKVSAQVFKTEPERMKRLLEGNNKQITKPLPKEKAERMASVFSKLGLSVDVVEMASEIIEVPEVPVEMPVQHAAHAEVHAYRAEQEKAPSFSRNWPDVLIAIALFALLAGIVTTIVTGRSLLPVSQSNPVIVTEANQVATGTVSEPQVTTNPSLIASSALEPDESSLATSASTETQARPVLEGSSSLVSDPLDAVLVEETAPQEVIGGTDIAVLPDLDLTVVQLEAEPVVNTTGEVNNTSGEANTVGEVNTVEALPEVPLLIASGQDPASTSTSLESTESGSSLNTPEDLIASTAELEAGQYIQAGAYSSLENAAFQKAKLEQLGLPVANVQDFNFVVLLAGPFEASDLESAVATLNEQNVSFYLREFP